MGKIISCCGTICTDCEYYPGACAGCPEIEGKAFWLEYTGGAVCEIYDCCVRQRQYAHCGACQELPCSRYQLEDPTKSAEENARDSQRQMEQLAKMKRLDGLVETLCHKDNNEACESMMLLEEESQRSDGVYAYFSQFAEMLRHKNSFVRNRGLRLIAANAKWDADNRVDEVIDEYVKHVTDAKPITARQCIQALPQIIEYKPELREIIREALLKADTDQYASSMRPLIQKDIAAVLKLLPQQQE